MTLVACLAFEAIISHIIVLAGKIIGIVVFMAVNTAESNKVVGLIVAICTLIPFVFVIS